MASRTLNGARGRRRFWIVAVSAIALAALATGCDSAATAQSSAKTIKVGVISDMTGPDAEFGKIFYNGAKLAFDAIPAQTLNGHKVSFVYYDDASDPATATSVARRAVQQDHVDVLYGQPYTQTALAVVNVAMAMKVPFFDPGSSAPALTDPFKKYVFAGQFSANAYGQAVAKLICSMGISKVGMIYESDTYGNQNLAAMKQFLPSCGLTVDAAEPIGATDTSALTQVDNLRKAGVQVIVDGTVAGPTVALLKSQLATGFTVPTMSFAGEVASIDQILQQNPTLSFYTVTPIACPLLGNCTTDVRQKWQQAYGTSTIAPWGAQAYAQGMAFVQGLDNYAKKPDAGFVTAFESISYASPITTHPIQFSAKSHRGQGDCSIEGITNGKVTFFGTTIKGNTLSTPVDLG